MVPFSAAEAASDDGNLPSDRMTAFTYFLYLMLLSTDRWTSFGADTELKATVDPWVRLTGSGMSNG